MIAQKNPHPKIRTALRLREVRDDLAQLET